MHRDQAIPKVAANASLQQALIEMSEKGLGMTAVVDAEQRLIGIFTDGDLRRTLNRPLNIRDTLVSEVMTPHGATVPAEMLAAEALQIMDEKKINGFFVVDAAARLIGAFNMHDLLRAGVV